jgi:hypothetical protein
VIAVDDVAPDAGAGGADAGEGPPSTPPAMGEPAGAGETGSPSAGEPAAPSSTGSRTEEAAPSEGSALDGSDAEAPVRGSASEGDSCSASRPPRAAPVGLGLVPLLLGLALLRRTLARQRAR